MSPDAESVLVRRVMEIIKFSTRYQNSIHKARDRLVWLAIYNYYSVRDNECTAIFRRANLFLRISIKAI